ncbi:CotY/CotZ family spore coat protein [Virgibacillus necropolis]|uniref:Spore coat protein n=1 Tax=Virgibacillus necropolis TaxID=163877 RepID=A0A221MFQ1_9BACI|nr:CotY/CotZ family spore coat protein [Virgibacillus necropolis]ASN06496.1 spore coat protein [Virgibacillus necropolis]
MGCCGKDYETGNCVCDILKEIAEAQNDVVENCCDTSCERSINDLLGDNDNGNGLDTVPVILYCKDGCKPFKGFGANHDDYKVEDSFFFRVKRVDKDCCATLELLVDDKYYDDDDDDDDDDDRDRHRYDKDRKHYKKDSPEGQCVKDLRASGICITVNVDCFCHVTCLPAIDAFSRY